ncbi:hypothetical protein QZH41_008689, partial [Actinostola sp. cb2023]
FNDLWGFQVHLIDLTFDNPMMSSQCKQINVKEKSRYYVQFERLSFGANYQIRVQSMPPDGYESTVTHNVYIKEKCDIPEFQVTHFCCQFSSVFLHVDECRMHEKPSVSINITWKLACNNIKQFKLKWNTNDPFCCGTADVNDNNTYIYTIILPEVCTNKQRNYTGEIYGISAQHTTTKTQRFWFSIPIKLSSATSIAPTSSAQSTSSDMKIVAAVVSTGTVFGILLVVLLFVFWRQRASPVIRLVDYNQSTPDSDVEQILPDPIKVLILYASCCMSCKKVLYSLWDVLDCTNLFDVRLDMLSEPKLNENPLRWYETQVKEAARILLVTSRLMLMADLNPTSDTTETDISDYVSIGYQLNLLRGELCNTTDISKFVPVYMSYNGSKPDIPRFLSMCRTYKLAPELDKIMLHLLGMSSIRKHSRRPIVEIGSDDHPFNTKKDALVKAIADAEHFHKQILSQCTTRQSNLIV